MTVTSGQGKGRDFPQWVVTDKLQTEVIEEIGFLVPSLLVVGVLSYLGPCVYISKQPVVVDVDEVCSGTMWSKITWLIAKVTPLLSALLI